MNNGSRVFSIATGAVIALLSAATSAAPPVAESTEFTPPKCTSSVASEIPQAKQTSPLVNVSQFGAKGDGTTDDTEAINRAIQSMKQGGTLVFEQGKTYLKTGNIVVNNPGVHLWGYGATVYAYVPASVDLAKVPGAAQISIQLNAPRTGVYGLTVISNLRTRISHPNGVGIWLASADQEVLDTRIEYTGAGIFARGASNFIIARNVVFRTAADGIHITMGSHDGRILCNTVRQTGDDLIAVVNYGLGEPSIGNFRIEGNDVAGNYWGRGITVAGGRDVTIRGNHIAETTHAAAIYIASESSYKTANVRNVLVEQNEISDVQTTTPKYNLKGDTKATGMGAILVQGQSGQEVRGVTIRGNKIDRALKEGIVIRGNACDIGVQGNAVGTVGASALRMEPDRPGECNLACAGNTVGDKSDDKARCQGTPPDARGASL